MHKEKNNLPNGYKMTELGPLPEEWQVVRLGEVAREKKYKNMENRKLQVYSVSNLMGFVKSEDFFDKQVYSTDLRNYKIVSKGEFAYNPARANVGSIALFNDVLPGLVSPMYTVFEVVSPQIDNKFLFLLLKSERYIKEIKRISQSRGSIRQILAFRDLADFPIPLPPLPEQRAIAHMLRTVQKAKETTERVIAALRELKKSLMRHLFTFGPVPVGNVGTTDRSPLKETEIGPIPKHWQVVRLEEVVMRAFGGGTPSTNNPNFWGGSIPWTTSATIQENDVELRKFQRTITEEGLKNSATALAPKGSLLVGTRVGVGKAVVVLFDVAISQDLTALIINEEIVNPFFLAYLFKGQYYQSWFNNNKRGATIKGVPRKDLIRITIPLPPLPEQQEIARILQAVDNRIQAEAGYRKSLEALFKTLLHELMTGKRRVRADDVLPQKENPQ